MLYPKDVLRGGSGGGLDEDNNNLIKFTSYPVADKTKDLLDCRVLHHSKAA